MSTDISKLLEDWPYETGQVMVRRLVGDDGQEKIQLRVDLGLLQMNTVGRPDGKKPGGHESLLEFYVAKLEKHRAEHDGQDEGFVLGTEDCAKIQQEAIQYHHRYICHFQLEDFDGVLRDAERNLEVFDLVDSYAESDELAWSIQQFRPQLLLMFVRARGTLALKEDDYDAATEVIGEGIDAIREFYTESGREELLEQSAEIPSLQNWLTEIQAKKPLSKREKLEKDLNDAVSREDYEKAAEVRDALRKLPASGNK